MKKYFIAYVAGSILALATNGANAQNSVNSNSGQKNEVTIETGKYILPVETNVGNINSMINAKALKNFKREYKNPSEEKWMKNKNDFAVQFASNDVNNIVYYDKKGNKEGSLKIYLENKFDRDLRKIVKQVYFDYKITLVQEIETPETNGKPTFIVHLEGNDDFKLIRLNDETMEVYKEF